MTEGTNPKLNRNRRLGWVVLVFVIIIALLLIRSVRDGVTRPLKPIRPTLPAGTLATSDSSLVSLTFSELNEDPFAMRDRRIRVSGDYTSLERKACRPIQGPDIRWALVSGDLQLNAYGFENVLALTPDGLTLIVEGVWRLYEGPAGCGKSPPVGSVWFLEVERIVEPNPLVRAGAADLVDRSELGGLVTPGTDSTSSPTADAQAPDLEATPLDPGDEPTPDSGVTETPQLGITLTPPATESPTPTPSEGDATPTLSSQSMTATTAPTAGVTRTPTATSSPTPGNTATPGPGATPMPSRTPLPTLPSFATATPGAAYPGLGSTATFTPTPSSYP